MWKKFIPSSVWLDSDMAFKLELSKAQVSSAFTPIDDEIVPHQVQNFQIQVPLKSLWDKYGIIIIQTGCGQG